MGNQAYLACSSCAFDCMIRCAAMATSMVRALTRRKAVGRLIGNAFPCNTAGDHATGGCGVVWTGGPNAGCPEENRASATRLAATSKDRTVPMVPTRAMNCPHWAACAASSDWRKPADFSGNADYSEYRMGKERRSKERPLPITKTTSFPPRAKARPAPFM